MATPKKDTKTRTRPVSSTDLPQATEPTTMSDAGIAAAGADSGGILRSDEPPVDAAEVSARQKQAKADARAARKIADAKAKVTVLKEKLDPDALTIDDVADDSQTEAQQDFSWDVRPDFSTMDEAGILAYMRKLTQWLRDRDAVVRGPMVTEHEIEDTAAVEVTREGSQDAGAAKKKTMTVYEGFYEWEYAEAPPITIRRPHVTYLDALRDVCRDAVGRRYEV